MEWLILILLAVGVLWWRQASKAKAIVRSRTADLARITGTPASQIEQEIIERRITPGQWAREHGLDPMTFQPLGQPQPEGTDAQGRPFGISDEPQPPQSPGNTTEVRQLQELYANLVSFGAGLSAEFAEIDRVYGLLRDLGADADQILVDQEKTKNADWMTENPGLSYYEPHLHRERFDSERPDRQ